ncbi:hypothetical protein LEN26_010609 [Aphanomyces euteiches]|nr:hypothetical protein AeMF1_018156 [Aphanomyces euteiches]KAH9121589.1 hypothetical protein LEN26_010609 [Aphanomyces euteiches]KAH9195058.1 hypothetical protein AeNC1_002945 [Aphanomyces euteiches]
MFAFHHALLRSTPLDSVRPESLPIWVVDPKTLVPTRKSLACDSASLLEDIAHAAGLIDRLSSFPAPIVNDILHKANLFTQVANETFQAISGRAPFDHLYLRFEVPSEERHPELQVLDSVMVIDCVVGESNAFHDGVSGWVEFDVKNAKDQTVVPRRPICVVPCRSFRRQRFVVDDSQVLAHVQVGHTIALYLHGCNPERSLRAVYARIAIRRRWGLPTE